MAADGGKALQEGVMSAKSALTTAQAHLTKAISEAKFAGQIANGHLSGAAARNVKGAAANAIKAAKEAVQTATEDVDKAEKAKSDAESDMNNEHSKAERLDVTSSKKAAETAMLQQDAMNKARMAKADTQAAKEDAEEAAELTAQAKQAGARASDESGELEEEKEKVKAAEDTVEADQEDQPTAVEELRESNDGGSDVSTLAPEDW